jgi:hypothetical protein
MLEPTVANTFAMKETSFPLGSVNVDSIDGKRWYISFSEFFLSA